MLKDIILKIRNRFKSKKKRRFVILRRPVYFQRHLKEEKNFLILTTGPTLGEYRKAIQRFIENNKPNLRIMACNFIDNLCIPDYHIIVNRKKFHTYAHAVPQKSTLLLAPYFAKPSIRSRIGKRYYEEVMYKGIYSSDKGSLKIDKRGVVYVKACTCATIACGVAIAMGAKDILFAGLDGFSMYRDRPDDIHFYPESDSIPFDKRLMQENGTRDILKDASQMLRGRGGKLRIITPTVYKEFYNESILR